MLLSPEEMEKKFEDELKRQMEELLQEHRQNAREAV